MKILRTPDARFADLPDFAFTPNYIEVGGHADPLRLAYIDEGPRAAAPILMLHGEPTWSFLYRKIIAALADRHRVVAPDLIGFGRSDKPVDQSDYSYEGHVAWMGEWLQALDLRNITLFCQDWGGLIGLRLVAAFPDRFVRVVVANTGMPIGVGMTEGFQRWLALSQSTPILPVGMIVNMGSQRELSAAEIAAYDAPYPDESYKAGARVFPTLVPITPAHASVAENKAAWESLARLDIPFVTAFSDADPITSGGEKIFHERLPGTRGQPHVTLKGGHFLQEDCPDDIAALLDRLVTKG